MSRLVAPSLRERTSGVLLHISSLPSTFGIGDLGGAAFDWIDALARAGQTWWQVLPLTPTGYGGSPYQSLSSFAGNSNFISPLWFVEQGLLAEHELPYQAFPRERVDFDEVTPFKGGILLAAWERFQARTSPLRSAFDEFCDCEASWLDDFALFNSLKDAHGGRSWIEWDRQLRLRDPSTLASISQTMADAIGRQKFAQFVFFEQFRALKQYASSRGVRLIGDVPIFVAADSVDVWANPELFLLDDTGRPKVVAGVPPDYFSITGQLWGNPLYDWGEHKTSGYAWWVARLRAALRHVDVVRLDHFRGFEANWEVPAGLPTAEHGRWVFGPGADLLETLARELGELPLIAEDLGVITPPVEALRRKFGLPGMSILQFAFGGGQEDRFLPHNQERNTVIYTGTHDNDTTLGWFNQLTPEEVEFFCKYAPRADVDPAWTLIRLAWGSVANLAIAPLQDVLGLGNESRMNLPGTANGNWRWRLSEDLAVGELLGELAELTATFQREPRISPSSNDAT